MNRLRQVMRQMVVYKPQIVLYISYLQIDVRYCCYYLNYWHVYDMSSWGHHKPAYSPVGLAIFRVLFRDYFLSRRENQYRIHLEIQFSWDLKMARFEPGASRSQSGPLPQSYLAAVMVYVEVQSLYDDYCCVLFNYFMYMNNCHVEVIFGDSG